MFPQLGAAGTSYARSVNPTVLRPGALPDPSLIYDSVMKRTEYKKHPNNVSSVLWYWASIVIHGGYEIRMWDDGGSNKACRSLLDRLPRLEQVQDVLVPRPLAAVWQQPGNAGHDSDLQGRQAEARLLCRQADSGHAPGSWRPPDHVQPCPQQHCRQSHCHQRGWQVHPAVSGARGRKGRCRVEEVRQRRVPDGSAGDLWSLHQHHAVGLRPEHC